MVRILYGSRSGLSGRRDEQLLWYQRILVHDVLPQTIGKHERPQED